MQSSEHVSRPSVATGTPLGAALQRLRDSPYRGNVNARVSTVAAEVVNSFHKGELEHCVAAAAVITLEENAPEDGIHRGYGIAVHRMLSGQLLEQVAPMLLDPLYADDVRKILGRAGVDGTDTLLKLLIAAPTIAERRTYFKALCGLSEGTHLAVRILEDDRWFVVRNMAELCGELQLEEAVPSLGKALNHSDPRVRRSAAGALARTGSPATVEHLRKALKDEDRETRLVVARALSGKKWAALAMPLVMSAEDEQDLELKREYFLALGRIGTPDAVQALIKTVSPGGRFLGRKPKGPRLAAVEGLRLAGGSTAIGALKGLERDPDKAVRKAARTALQELQP